MHGALQELYRIMRCAGPDCLIIALRSLSNYHDEKVGCAGSLFLLTSGPLDLK